MSSDTTLSDDEREAYIADCARRFHAAYSAGDRETAYEWLRMQNEAIKARTDERIAEMERAMGCFFCEEGEADRARMESERGLA